MAKKGTDPVEGAVTDGSYNQLSTPLNVPKASPDPQADLKNEVIPHASRTSNVHDPMGYLSDLTGERGRRGDPPK